MSSCAAAPPLYRRPLALLSPRSRPSESRPVSAGLAYSLRLVPGERNEFNRQSSADIDPPHGGVTSLRRIVAAHGELPVVPSCVRVREVSISSSATPVRRCATQRERGSDRPLRVGDQTSTDECARQRTRAGDGDRTRMTSLEVRPSRLTVDVGGASWLVSTGAPTTADSGGRRRMCHRCAMTEGEHRACANGER